MKRRILPGVTGVLWMCLIPYLCTVGVNGAETALQNRKFQAEMFLPAVVASQISGAYELETVKAQAVIARSNFCRSSGKEKNRREATFEMMQEICEKLKPTYYMLFHSSSIFEQAVTETEGKVLTFGNELKLLPYHEISAGRTRSGMEVMKDGEYAYLQSVESSGDKEAEAYLGSVYVKTRQLPKDLKITKRDSAGYVTELTADGKRLDGEAFRLGLGLASANFTIQKVGGNLRFLCKGKGHGLGFSQYGGNVLAKSGCTYGEILETYFPGMELESMNCI